MTADKLANAILNKCDIYYGDASVLFVDAAWAGSSAGEEVEIALLDFICLTFTSSFSKVLPLSKSLFKDS